MHKECETVLEGSPKTVRAGIDLRTFPVQFCPVIMTTLKKTRELFAGLIPNNLNDLVRIFGHLKGKPVRVKFLHLVRTLYSYNRLAGRWLN
jgi:hypothetical protein